MKRLVFKLTGAVGPDTRQYVAISLEEPVDPTSQSRPFTCDCEEQPFVALRAVDPNRQSVKEAGRRLYEAVAEHPEVHDELKAALKTVDPDRYPVFVNIGSPSGLEVLPWETLCSPTGEFLGLDERWAVGRMVGGPDTKPFWSFSPPLRVAVVLSCLGIPAVNEWRAVRDALIDAPLDLEVLAVVSEPALYEEIQTSAPNVRVAYVPADVDALQTLLSSFGPHVMHLFCHGSTRGGPHIEVAAKSDWKTGSPDNSLILEARQIRQCTPPTAEIPWLVVLNCCESAAMADIEDLQSLARDLVAYGAPAVVGMREPVASDDASRFTDAFYKRLRRDLAVKLGAPPGTQHAIDWAQLVVQARARLAERYRPMTLSQAAATTKEWTLPVVYVRPQAFNVLVTAPPPPTAPATEPKAQQLELELLDGLRAQLPPDSPPGLLDDIMQRMGQLQNELAGT